MGAIRKCSVVAFVGMIGLAAIGPAAAHLRRRHVAHRIVHHFVFASPDAVKAVSDAGVFGSVFSTGILGASTADPYTTPAYGYDGNGYNGPGFAHPGY